jgi:hypothetical protein
MLRRFLLACGGLLALTTGALLLQAGQVGTPDSAKSGKDDDSAKVKDKLSLEEQVLANRFQEFEAKLLRLKQRLEHSSRPEDRERAVILQKALEKAREASIGTRFEQMVDYLKKQRLSNIQDVKTAQERSLQLADDLRAILALLREDSRSAKLKEERKRLEELWKEVKRIENEEKRLQGQVQLGKTDPRELKGAQARNANDTNKLAKEMAKGSDGKGGEAKNNKGENKDAGKGNGKKGDAKDAGKSAEARAGKGKDGGKGGEAKPAQAKAGQGKKGEGAQQAKAGQAKDGGQKGGDAKSAQAKTGEQKAGQAGAKAGQPKEGQSAQAKTGQKGGAQAASSKKGGDQKSGQASKSGQGAQAKSKAGGSKSGQSQAKAGQGSKSGQASQSKSGSQKSQQAQAKGGSSSSSQGQSKSGQQGQQAKNKNDNSPPQQQAQNPLSKAQKRVREAYDKERSAEDNIGKKNDDAAKDQGQAIKKLDDARKRLEELLRQLREEEMERLLADLQARCQKMLRMQIRVYEGTLTVHKGIEATADKKATRLQKQDSLKLSDDEKAIVLEASKAIQILEEEGSAVAFPEVFQQVREDMRNVQIRLGVVDTGKITQATEEDIISTLRDMIKALEKAKKQLAKSKGGKSGQSQPQDQKLLDQIAELKMIRAMQIRVNARTKLYGRQYEGEQANDANLRREVRGLGERQERIFEVTNRIVREENR